MAFLKCSFRVIPSHVRSERGSHFLNEGLLKATTSVVDQTILGICFRALSITSDGDGGIIEATLDGISDDRLDQFVDEMEAALTAWMGVREINPYYGTSYVQINRSTIEWRPDKAQNALSIQVSLDMKITKQHLLLQSDLIAFEFDPMLQLYSDGLRATTAESKFLSWFIILEEFVEKAGQFSGRFQALFSAEDMHEVEKLAVSLGGRKKEHLTGVKRATLEGRAKKLADMLAVLGVDKIQAAGTSLEINEQVCETLIKQRNKLFHRGLRVQEDAVYNLLFPIVTKLVTDRKALGLVELDADS